ncbi:MAG TPA: hypothetical protein PLL05_06505, partial [Muribaculaceae bacterium]|nr:hypothetical protein [Muribaculaceae bacterium]
GKQFRRYTRILKRYVFCPAKNIPQNIISAEKNKSSAEKKTPPKTVYYGFGGRRIFSLRSLLRAALRF